MKCKINLLVLLLSVIATQRIQAQQLTKQDTILYLMFSGEKTYKSDVKVVDPITLEEHWESQYNFPDSHLYDRYPLQFVSKQKCLSNKIYLKDLNKYPVVTIEQLRKFISHNYNTAFNRSQSSSYFNNLENIYIVEIDERQRLATITEVKLDITIE